MKMERKGRTRTVVKLTLPPQAVRGLKKLGLGGEVNRLNRALRGDSPTLRETDRLVPPTQRLNAVFQSVSPKLSPKLYGSVVARFWEIVYFTVTVSENLRRLAHVNGRFRRKQLRSLLGQIHEVGLWGLRREVEGLRRAIPRLIEQLGGDPSEELLSFPRRRGTRHRSRQSTHTATSPTPRSITTRRGT